MRALESYFGDESSAPDTELQASLMIKPGYSFKVVDAMITNFHQPKSTHLLLVAAFVGEAEVENIYSHALENEYRFLSYGDGMFLERN